jgi:chromosomal replication initiation ATPase DnaA
MSEKLIATVLSKRLVEMGLLEELEAVCKTHQVPIKEVLSGSRFRNAVRARRALCWLLRDKYKFSFPDIGRALGIDHTTVMYAVKMHLEKLNAAE